MLAFFATRSTRCERQVDVLERVRRRFPDVGFAAVSVRGDRGDVRRTVRRRGWGMAVGYDHDGAVSNAYAVAVCPTITFARRGGKVAGTSFALLGEAALAPPRGGACEMTWIDPEVAEEFPELRLHELTLDARSGSSPPELRERLRVLSDRFRGAAGRGRCASSRCRGPTACSSATSGSTPTSTARRSRRSRSSG